MWDLSSLTRGRTRAPALQGGFLATGSPGESPPSPSHCPFKDQEKSISSRKPALGTTAWSHLPTSELQFSEKDLWSAGGISGLISSKGNDLISRSNNPPHFEAVFMDKELLLALNNSDTKRVTPSLRPTFLICKWEKNQYLPLKIVGRIK